MLFINGLSEKIYKENINHVINVLTINVILILGFAVVYYYYGDPEHFYYPELNTKKRLNYLDCVYYSAITQTTVGYGDITGKSTNIRLVNCLQILLMIVSIGLKIL